MRTFKIRGLISISLSVLSLILLLILHTKKSDLLVSLGSQNLRLLTTCLWILSLVGLIALISQGFLYFKELKNQQEEETRQLEESKDPLYEEASIIQKLESFLERYESNPDAKAYLRAVSTMLDQITESKTLSKDFEVISENNDQPIIENIQKELITIRVHLLSNAKSIYRRALILEDLDTINEKLSHNRKVLDDADKLILEAISYIEAKSNNTSLDLENLTESLKELIKLI